MRRKTGLIITTVVCGIVGSLYLFGPYKFIKQTLGIGFGLRHNDHVMVGIIGVTIAVCGLYALLAKKGGSAKKKVRRRRKP